MTKGNGKDTRPWKPEPRNDGMLGGGTVMVAHADMKKGADDRWPLGSAMNSVKPGVSESSHSMQRYAIRQNINLREDNNEV